MDNGVALTEAGKVAAATNDKHREVQCLGRTAKEIAAEIGEMLIVLKANPTMKHGRFIPRIEANCSFSERSAQDYIRIAKAKAQHATVFKRCTSIREVLALKKPKPALEEIRVVEKLKATTSHLSAPEHQREG